MQKISSPQSKIYSVWNRITDYQACKGVEKYDLHWGETSIRPDPELTHTLELGNKDIKQTLWLYSLGSKI